MTRITSIISAPVVSLVLGMLLFANIIYITKCQPNTNVLECYCNENLWGDDENFAELVSDILDDVVFNVPADPDYIDYTMASYGYDEVYGYGNCSEAILMYECYDCMRASRAQLTARCPQAKGGTLIMADCRIRYEDYDFYPD